MDHGLIPQPKNLDEMRREDQEKAAFRKNDMEAYITARTRLRAGIKEVKLEETQHKDRLQAIQDISAPRLDKSMLPDELNMVYDHFDLLNKESSRDYNCLQLHNPVWYNNYKLSSFAGRGQRSWTSGWLKNDQGGRSQQKRCTYLIK